MQTEVKFGLIVGLGICVYTTVAHLLGFYTNNIQAGKYGDAAIILLPLVVLFLAIREKRNHNASLTLFQGIKTGLLVVLVSFPVSSSFLWIYHQYINPNWFEFILDYEQNSLLRAGVSEEEIASRIDRLRAGNSDFAQIIGGFVGTFVLGFVLSFIFSLILRRKPRTA